MRRRLPSSSSSSSSSTICGGTCHDFVDCIEQAGGVARRALMARPMVARSTMLSDNDDCDDSPMLWHRRPCDAAVFGVCGRRLDGRPMHTTPQTLVALPTLSLLSSATPATDERCTQRRPARATPVAEFAAGSLTDAPARGCLSRRPRRPPRPLSPPPPRTWRARAPHPRHNRRRNGVERFGPRLPSLSKTRLLSGSALVLPLVLLLLAGPGPMTPDLAAAQPTPASSLAPTDRVCSCTPTIYRWTLDFSAVCPPPNVLLCPTCGVDDLFCDLKKDAANDAVGGGAGNATDVVPEVVESYTVLELDAGFQVIKQFTRGGLELRDGDMIEYASITASEASVPVRNRPAALQMSMEGRNGDGVELQSQWIVTFTRLCDVVPFQAGDGISWSIFTELVPPRPELCDVTQPPTIAPTSAPTPERTPAPTQVPTQLPTRLPTRKPTREPTREPTANVPTIVPTKAPVTSAPTELNPTLDPTGPGSTPDPTGPGSTQAPTGPDSTPAPTGPGSTPAPTGPGSTPAPTGPGSTQVPTGRNSTPIPTLAPHTPGETALPTVVTTRAPVEPSVPTFIPRTLSPTLTLAPLPDSFTLRPTHPSPSPSSATFPSLPTSSLFPPSASPFSSPTSVMSFGYGNIDKDWLDFPLDDTDLMSLNKDLDRSSEKSTQGNGSSSQSKDSQGKKSRKGGHTDNTERSGAKRKNKKKGTRRGVKKIAKKRRSKRKHRLPAHLLGRAGSSDSDSSGREVRLRKHVSKKLDDEGSSWSSHGSNKWSSSSSSSSSLISKGSKSASEWRGPPAIKSTNTKARNHSKGKGSGRGRRRLLRPTRLTLPEVTGEDDVGSDEYDAAVATAGLDPFDILRIEGLDAARVAATGRVRLEGRGDMAGRGRQERKRR